MNQEGNMVAVKAKLPVAELLGWSNDLRSATSGRGVSSLVDQAFERMPDELQEKVKKQIRSRKKISLDAEVAKGSG
jgi:elongation factor 2